MCAVAHPQRESDALEGCRIHALDYEAVSKEELAALVKEMGGQVGASPSPFPPLSALLATTTHPWLWPAWPPAFYGLRGPSDTSYLTTWRHEFRVLIVVRFDQFIPYKHKRSADE